MPPKSKKPATPRTLVRDKHGSGVIPTVRQQLGPRTESESVVDDPQQELTRTRAERDILRARYQDLYDSLPVGHLTLDVLGTIVDANLAATSLFGRDQNQLVGSKFAAFVNTADADILRAHRQQVFAGSMPSACDVTLQRADGAAVGVAVQSRITKAGECSTTLLEVHERQKQEHTRRMQSVAAVAAGVAHDFSNLLTGILGFAESCLAQLEPEHGARGRLEEIMTAALTGATLVRRLMTVGQSTPAISAPGHFDAVVRTLAPLLRRLIGEQIELRIELAAENACVQCGSGEIEQIVLNLVINARQSMPLGGRVEVETAEIEVSEHDAGQAGLAAGIYVRLIVRDTGCGMDESTLKHALDPFYTTKQGGGGTGLGLSTVLRSSVMPVVGSSCAARAARVPRSASCCPSTAVASHRGAAPSDARSNPRQARRSCWWRTNRWCARPPAITCRRRAIACCARPMVAMPCSRARAMMVRSICC